MGGGRIATEVLLAQWVQLNTKYLITETSSREMPRQSTVHSLRFPPKLTNPYFWPESALREDSPNPPRIGQGSPEVFFQTPCFRTCYFLCQEDPSLHPLKPGACPVLAK